MEIASLEKFLLERIKVGGKTGAIGNSLAVTREKNKITVNTYSAFSKRKAIELELRSPQNVNGIAADPQPDWSLDNLLLELNTIDKKLNTAPEYLTNKSIAPELPEHFTRTQQRELRTSKEGNHSACGFLMYVSEDESSNDTDYDTEEEAHISVVYGRRFVCDELYVSDDDEDEIPLGMQCLMDKAVPAESTLIELTHEFQLSVTEEVRSKISSMEAEVVHEYERFTSLINKVGRHREFQRGNERQFDLHYQRTIAEALDNHLTAIQRDLAHISQIEEKRIRDDATREESKRKEKALLEEKLRQERIQAEEEARLRVEQSKKAKAAALEAEKKAAEEAVAKLAAETSRNTAPTATTDRHGTLEGSVVAGVYLENDIKLSARNVIRASENALELEKRRLQIFEELSAKNTALKLSSNQDYHRYGLIMGRKIRTISAILENVRTKAEELVKLISSEGCPQSIGIQLFAEKMVSNCTNQKSTGVVLATCRVIVLVTSKIPVAMDILLAELNTVCIYTVPKHIFPSKEVFKTNDSYFKAIGYAEVDGIRESTNDYIERLECYMRLYGALVQTEVPGIQNRHGLKEGWAWLARFLNSLPANLYSAAALNSFLKMAGYALYSRYRNQFEKLLIIIARDFLNSIKLGGSESSSTKLNLVKTSLRSYIELRQYLEEPEGLQLRGHIESNEYLQ